MSATGVSAHITVTTRWSLGRSAAPFDRGNLAAHVGDDPVIVAGNRDEAARAAGIEPDQLVVMDPVHGSDVHVISCVEDVVRTDIGRIAPKADALVTAEVGIGLLVLGADCAPVTLIDDEHGVIGVVHVGWKGLVAGVLDATLTTMRDLGARPDSLRLAIHPTICGPCYPVPPERADAVAPRLPQAVVRARDGQPAIDLRAGLVEQARAGGVAMIEVDERCTHESADLFSHRRDAVTGRQGVVLVRR